jgi:Mg-chelatase subunit ChlD
MTRQYEPAQPHEPTFADDQAMLRRWRLILGRYAESELPTAQQDREIDQALGYLYDRQYTSRGHRHGTGTRPAKTGGGSQGSAPTAVSWLHATREFFPQSTFERMERDAITTYGMDDLLANPDTVESLTADPALAATLLRMRGKLNPETAQGLRILIRKVVEDILERLKPKFATSLTGSRQRFRRSFHASSKNLDWRKTIAVNLKNVDPNTGRMLIDDVRFVSRQRRQNLNWDVIVLVDQSGSMAQSLLHASVSAAIMSGLAGVNVSLLLFDTSIVDMTHLAHDPVEVLMTSQLGGGTDIARALAYAEQRVTQPSRTVIALISDFDEGGPVASLISTTRRLAESGVTMLGLAALEDNGTPWYNESVAGRLAGAGMDIAAMTPDRFAEWLGEVMA